MHKALVIIALLTLSGCISLPTLRQPAVELPVTPPATTTSSTSIMANTQEHWWTLYADPDLDQLMQEALDHNADLQLAAARIEEARANLALEEGARDPTLQAGLGASRTRASGANSFTPPTLISNKLQVGLQGSYEVDWWGQYRNASLAARSDLLASRMGREVVRSELTALTARTWFRLRNLDAQLKLADQTLANRRQWLALQQLRQQVGELSELELRQAEVDLAAIEASRTQRVRAISQQENALAVLLGRAPRQMAESGLPRAQCLPKAPDVPDGLPSDLLTRRPDIRQAEAELAAAEARIDEAKSAIWPSLSLTANLGSESKALSKLFSGPAMVWGLAASLTQTLYNAGRTEAALQARAARREQALTGYEQAVRMAFQETLDALVAVRQSRELAAAETRRVTSQRRATELAGLRYQNGMYSQIDLLDAQSSLYQAELDVLSADLDRLTATVDLFKALGGGFQATAAQ